MTPKGKMKSYMGYLWTLCLFMALVVMFLMYATVMSGCKHTEYVEVPVVHTDTIWQHQVQKDSVWLHDSIHIRELGDSVLIYKYQTKYIERLRTDTLYEHRVDTIAKPYPVEVKVEKALTWWQKTKMNMGVALLILLGCCVVVGAWKLYQKFKP